MNSLVHIHKWLKDESRETDILPNLNCCVSLSVLLRLINTVDTSLFLKKTYGVERED